VFWQIPSFSLSLLSKYLDCYRKLSFSASHHLHAGVSELKEKRKRRLYPEFPMNEKGPKVDLYWFFELLIGHAIPLGFAQEYLQ
jgi:hypothetical protein